MLFLSLLISCVETQTNKTQEPTIIEDGSMKFVVLGDAGEGTKLNMTLQMQPNKFASKMDVILPYILGIIYDTGVESVDDIQFLEKFEQPYANIDVPFYVVLGNHDYDWGTSGKPDPQVAYTEISDK